MVKATKKIIKKFTKATHGHPLFIKILFENLTFFTQGNGITRLSAAFVPFGEVKEAKIPTDPKTRKHKGGGQ